jgi:hypothetical protein
MHQGRTALSGGEELLGLLPLLVLLLVLAPGAAALAGGQTYQTGFTSWRSDGGLGTWTPANGAGIVEGSLGVTGSGSLETDSYPPGSYHGGDFYTGGSYYVSEATSPEVQVSLAAREAVASSNASTPEGTWIETWIRVQLDDDRWSKWYNLGVWASDDTTIERHSVPLQADADGYVAVDTWVQAKGKSQVTAFQLKVRLFRASSDLLIPGPTIRSVALAWSSSGPKNPSWCRRPGQLGDNDRRARVFGDGLPRRR